MIGDEHSQPVDVGSLLDEILTDAHGDDEQLWALHRAADVQLRTGSPGYPWLAAYCEWLGISPVASEPAFATRTRPRRHKASGDDIDLSKPLTSSCSRSSSALPGVLRNAQAAAEESGYLGRGSRRRVMLGLR